MNDPVSANTRAAGAAAGSKVEQNSEDILGVLGPFMDQMREMMAEQLADMRFKTEARLSALELDVKLKKEDKEESDGDSLHSAQSTSKQEKEKVYTMLKESSTKEEAFKLQESILQRIKDETPHTADKTKDIAMTMQQIPAPGQLGIIMGKQVMFDRKLSTIHDLHDLATHLDDFRKYKRKNYQSQQPLVSTLSDLAITELDLEYVNIAEWSSEKLIEYISSNLHYPRKSEEDILKAVNKIHLEGTVSVHHEGRQALIRHNYTRVHAYLDKVNGTLQLLKDLTGVTVTSNKRNLNAETTFDKSTVYQIVKSKIDTYGKGYWQVMIDGIDIKQFDTWASLSAKLQEKAKIFLRDYQTNARQNELTQILFSSIKRQEIRKDAEKALDEATQEKLTSMKERGKNLFKTAKPVTLNAIQNEVDDAIHERDKFDTSEEWQDDMHHQIHQEATKIAIMAHDSQQEETSTDEGKIAAIGHKVNESKSPCHDYMRNGCTRNECRYSHDYQTCQDYLATMVEHMQEIKAKKS